MPLGDRTGPRGKGSKTGRALGKCTGSKVDGYKIKRKRKFGRGVRKGRRIYDESSLEESILKNFSEIMVGKVYLISPIDMVYSYRNESIDSVNIDYTCCEGLIEKMMEEDVVRYSDVVQYAIGVYDGVFEELLDNGWCMIAAFDDIATLKCRSKTDVESIKQVLEYINRYPYQLIRIETDFGGYEISFHQFLHEE